MATTDPIADFLSRVRNAVMARHADVRVPASNMLRSLAQILTDEGFIASFDEDHDELQGTLVLQLRYAADKTNVITGIRRTTPA